MSAEMYLFLFLIVSVVAICFSINGTRRFVKEELEEKIKMDITVKNFLLISHAQLDSASLHLADDCRRIIP